MVARFISLFVLLAGFQAAAAWSQSAPVQPEGKIHFGSMGGFLPAIQPEEMPQAGSVEAQLVVRYCSQCHNSPSPGLHTAPEWEATFQRMYWRMHQANANLKNFEAPKYGEAEAMLAYLQKNAMRPVAINRMRHDQPGAREFLGICAQCHPLPDPAMHAAPEWKKVISRMQRHARAMGRFTPNEAEAGKILEFLSPQPAR